MKGLLVKDFTLLFKACKSILIIIAVFFVIIPFSDSYGFLNYYVIILAAMIPVTLVAYDEKEKWDLYFQTLPVSKSDYVSAKYLTGLTLEGFVFLVLVVLRRLSYSNTNDLLAYASFLFILGTVFLSVNLPVVFKFGSVKGRIVNIVLIIIVFALSFIGMELGSASLETVLNVISGKYNMPLFSGVIAAALLLVVSWIMSVAIYKKKEI